MIWDQGENFARHTVLKGAKRILSSQGDALMTREAAAVCIWTLRPKLVM